MALQFDRTAETTEVVGTGTAVLTGAVPNYQDFSTATGAVDSELQYGIVDDTNGAWEVGIGTYLSASASISRDFVLASSNGGALVSFAAGTKVAYTTQPAQGRVEITPARDADVGLTITALPTQTGENLLSEGTSGDVTTRIRLSAAGDIMAGDGFGASGGDGSLMNAVGAGLMRRAGFGAVRTNSSGPPGSVAPWDTYYVPPRSARNLIWADPAATAGSALDVIAQNDVVSALTCHVPDTHATLALVVRNWPSDEVRFQARGDGLVSASGESSARPGEINDFLFVPASGQFTVRQDPATAPTNNFAQMLGEDGGFLARNYVFSTPSQVEINRDRDVSLVAGIRAAFAVYDPTVSTGPGRAKMFIDTRGQLVFDDLTSNQIISAGTLLDFTIDGPLYGNPAGTRGYRYGRGGTGTTLQSQWFRGDGTTTQAMRLDHVAGDLLSTTGTIGAISDPGAKSRIEAMADGELAALMQVDVIGYDLDPAAFNGMGLNRIGFDADNMDAVYGPKVMTGEMAQFGEDDENGMPIPGTETIYKTVTWSDMVPRLVKALQEAVARIEQLEGAAP